MVIYMSNTATATNNTTGESHTMKATGITFEANLARNFGVTLVGYTVDQASKSVTWAATNGQTITVRFAA